MARVLGKLATEPIEDLRIDFEDGYGDHGDVAEDAAATAAGEALAAAYDAGEVPPFTGIRIRSFEPATRARGVRTLVRFLEALHGTLGAVPEGFVVTLPKVTSTEQVEAMVHACEHVDKQLGGRLCFEVQVETPQSVLGPEGQVLLARMIRAGEGRLTAFHYGTYDYSAACGIAAGQQSLEHPAADHAKTVMQVAAAGTGVRLSDGSTNRLPVGDHLVPGWQRAPPAGPALVGAWLLPGLGPPPGPAPDPLRRDPRVLPRRLRRPPPSGCARTSAARTPRSSTSRPRLARSPTSSSAASTAGRSTRRRSSTRPAWRPRRCC